ncbi:MAG: efflux RND transporter periplasmic adaptor subunit [Gemmatimonas sp.]|jgi:HlyD family secretion protein|uniref:efflux RND transporter periplasmic adaptor subunit n=1 Tax=Gemmatimonas sp. TaxID=1962908 RepID=UPI00391F6779|nr:efflux RND transporter periplasmic adaptor subunit [Gemmatimonadota bacterium]
MARPRSGPRLAGALLVALAACGQKQEASAPIPTAAVERRTIVVDAQATGAVEPINVIEVKSKASGQIVKMPVETGSQVNAGDLLVQVDTRDVKNQYDQAMADLRSAQASLEVAQAQRQRSDDLYKQRVITTQEYETAQLQLTQAQGQIVRATTNVDLAKQRLEDATVVAPVGGTIIEKPVALGQVIASATGSVTGGTTLLRMADLGKVRMRALVNETDIGSVRADQEARVTVDAYPDRPFLGAVEKIEPQAVVQQSVTMFPVIVSLDNKEGLLKPGMNGEVSLLVDRRENVLAVANDAVRTLREAAIAAGILKLNPDSVAAQVQAQQASLRGNGGGARSGDAAQTQAVATRDGASRSGASRSGASQGARANERERTGATAASGGRSPRARTALVFVETAPGRYAPRVVRLGASNYDYSEVLSGLAEGDKVALLAVGALQAKREQQNDRFRSMTGGGMPGMSAPAGGAAGGGGRPGGR